MKRQRLNMWQRAGVVASVVAWTVFTLGARQGDIDRAGYNAAPDGNWLTWAMFGLLPVVAAWILVFTAIWTARWIWAGRNR